MLAADLPGTRELARHFPNLSLMPLRGRRRMGGGGRAACHRQAPIPTPEAEARFARSPFTVARHVKRTTRSGAAFVRLRKRLSLPARLRSVSRPHRRRGAGRGADVARGASARVDRGFLVDRAGVPRRDPAARDLQWSLDCGRRVRRRVLVFSLRADHGAGSRRRAAS